MTILLVVHWIAAAMLSLGNMAALTTTVMARRSRDPKRILALLMVHKRVVLSSVVPGSMLLLASGAYMTYASQIPWTSGWLVTTLVLWVVSFVVGVAVLLPAESKGLVEAKALVDAGATTVSDALTKHVAGPAVVGGEWAAQVMWIVMFYLMLAKPF